MSLSDHIRFLFVAASLAEAEDRKLRQKHGINDDQGVTYPDENAIQWLREKRYETEKIKDYLNRLPHDTLVKLEALMYLGRDGGDWTQTLEYFKKLGEQKEDIIRTIIEKRSAYPLYFMEAMLILNKSSINVDSI